MHALAVSSELRGAVVRVAERRGPVRVVIAPQWQGFIDQCGVESSSNADSAYLVVGPPAFVLKHAGSADAAFGFVMPVARRRKLWQRSMAWRDDATLDLWRAGWSPQAIDRILVPTDDVVVEFVIGDVRRIPSVAGEPDGLPLASSR